MPTSDDFATLVESCVGVPFVPGGRTKAGLDCAGVIGLPLKELNLPFDDKSGYTLRIGTDYYQDIIQGLKKSFRQLKKVDWQRGDVIAYKHRGLPGHCAVYVGSPDGYPVFVEAVATKNVQRHGMATDWIDRIEKVHGEWSIWRLKA